MKSPSASWRKSVLRLGAHSIALFFVSLPVLAQAPPVAAFTTDPSPAEGGDSLTVQFVDQSTGAITSWAWDFGDLASSTEQNPAHTYGIGTFDVTLTVSGPGGSNSFTMIHAVDVVKTLFGFIGAPPPLSTMAVPLPDDLASFVKDVDAAVRLGKALLWDVQRGSDGLTACATCHYHAGTDNRVVNTLHPGADGVVAAMNSGMGGGPNYRLRSEDFPFHKFADPLVGDVLVATNDDRRGTTGVSRRAFSAIDPGSAVDVGIDQADPTFQVGGIDGLQATGRDAPTVIGSTFLLRNFWNGRANHFFNGRSIWGEQDPTNPTVLRMETDGRLSEVSILLNTAATASQAVGPPLSDVEMSWGNRSWMDVGKKMVSRTPLANQFVDPTDSRLGALANMAGPGLDPLLSYADLIQAAFLEEWWASSELVDGFTHMEANFSLFFGLAILAYESTLVPDQAPYDAFAAGDRSALTAEAQRGLGIFLGKGKCADCHATPLFAGNVAEDVLSHSDPNEGEGILERMDMGHALARSGLTLSTSPGPGELPLTFNPYRRAVNLLRNGVVVASGRTPLGSQCPPAGEIVITLTPGEAVTPQSETKALLRLRPDGLCGLEVDVELEWNEFGPAGGPVVVAFGNGNRFSLTMPDANTRAVYDNGFYNIGVRPSEEDLGVGGDGPFGPLSLTRRVQHGEDIEFESTGVGTVDPFQRIAVDGAFKTPTLRNVELTGPYFHNGGMATLEQVVEFYTRGTDFGSVNRHDLDPDVSGIEAMTQQDVADLVAFLKSLTDGRVRREQAPFDHPALPLKAGLEGNQVSILDDGSGNGIPRIEIIPATGAAGGPPIPTFEDRLRLPDPREKRTRPR